MTKDEAKKLAEDNWKFAERCDREGHPDLAHEARGRAIEYEKCERSLLYRWFGI